MVESKAGIHAGMHSNKGPRKFNQDCAFAGCLKNGSGLDVWLACVADGVGGGQHGEQAATLAVDALCSFVREKAFTDVTALKPLIPRWLAGLNDEIKQLSEDESVNTTLTACLVARDRSLIIHVGDTRVSIADDRSCRPVTKEHNDANEALKQGVEEEFVSAQDFRALSRCLGSGIDEVEPDIQIDAFPARSACWIIITSDGVHEKVASASMYQLARAASSAKELAVDLVTWAIGSGTKDNSTAAVLRIGKISPAGKKPVLEKHQSSISSPKERAQGPREKSSLVLISVALLLILLAVPLMWYALFGIDGVQDQEPESPEREYRTENVTDNDDGRGTVSTHTDYSDRYRSLPHVHSDETNGYTSNNGAGSLGDGGPPSNDHNTQVPPDVSNGTSYNASPQVEEYIIEVRRGDTYGHLLEQLRNQVDIHHTVLNFVNNGRYKDFLSDDLAARGEKGLNVGDKIRFDVDLAKRRILAIELVQ